MTDEAGNELIQSYVKMRQVCHAHNHRILTFEYILTSFFLKIGSGRGQVTAFPRQLESLIRLAEAHAKMRLDSLARYCRDFKLQTEKH